MNNPSDEQIHKIMLEAKIIALVGASANPERAAHGVMKFLQRAGYKVIPVNPGHDKILSEKTYASLTDIPDAIDIVDVFRRADATPDIARDAVKAGAKTLWLQLGIYNEEAEKIARTGGLNIIQDRCTAIEHRRLQIPAK